MEPSLRLGQPLRGRVHDRTGHAGSEQMMACRLEPSQGLMVGMLGIHFVSSAGERAYLKVNSPRLYL